jgi:hypothetical protein
LEEQGLEDPVGEVGVLGRAGWDVEEAGRDLAVMGGWRSFGL